LQNNIKNEYIISSTLLIFCVLLVRCWLDFINSPVTRTQQNFSNRSETTLFED